MKPVGKSLKNFSPSTILLFCEVPVLRGVSIGCEFMKTSCVRKLNKNEK